MFSTRSETVPYYIIHGLLSAFHACIDIVSRISVKRRLNVAIHAVCRDTRRDWSEQSRLRDTHIIVSCGLASFLPVALAFGSFTSALSRWDETHDSSCHQTLEQLSRWSAITWQTDWLASDVAKRGSGGSPHLNCLSLPINYLIDALKFLKPITEISGLGKASCFSGNWVKTWRGVRLL